MVAGLPSIGFDMVNYILLLEAPPFFSGSVWGVAVTWYKPLSENSQKVHKL